MIERGVEQVYGCVPFIAGQMGFRHVIQCNRHPHAIFHPPSVNGNPSRTHIPFNVFEGTIDEFVGWGK